MDYSLLLMLAAATAGPLLLVSSTSFAKFVIVLSLVRNALGSPSVPPAYVIGALSLVLTTFVMAPVASSSWSTMRTLEQPPTTADAVASIAEPWLGFLDRNAGDRERELFESLAPQLDDPSLQRARTIAPAFALTELKEAFTVGLLLLLPFLVVDIVIANLLVSLGLQSLDPATTSLPFKILLFVLADGWAVVVQSLVTSYA